jgi:dTDP-4-amino-4,6-dideoxy-D-galactose acyltransferase
MFMEKAYTSLQWDSDFFGFRVAQIDRFDFGVDGLSAMLQELRTSNYRLVYWQVPTEHPAIAAMAEKFGGVLVDEKITYLKELTRPASTDSPHSFDIAPYLRSEPEPALIDLALESGVYSRFRVDPAFPKALFEKLYICWITRAVRKEIAWEVLVVRNAGEMLGVVTLGEKEKRGAIGLMAVSPGSRGMGIGTVLVDSAERCFAEHGYDAVQIVTQRANAAACGLYESRHYQIESIDKVFHFWLQ